MSSRIIENTTQFIIGSDHPAMGSVAYPYQADSFDEALAIHNKIVGTGYHSEIRLCQTVTTETVVIPRNTRV